MKYTEDKDAVDTRLVHCKIHPEYDGSEDPIEIDDPNCMCDYIREAMKRSNRRLLEFNCPECKELLFVI